MCSETVFTAYKAWLVHREYSPATIEKYTRALRRFLRIQPPPRHRTARPSQPGGTPWPPKGTRPPPSTLCLPLSTITRKASTTRRAKPSRSNGSGGFSAMPTANFPAPNISACWLPQGIPATSARCCCCKRCAPPASACRNCLISRSKLCGGTKLPSAAKGSAVKFCCQQNFATGWNVGAGAGTFTRGRYFYRARASRWAGSRSGNC